MKFVPVDNVTCISILFYLHYFSNNVNKNNHILEQILLRFRKTHQMGNIIHYCISVEIQHKLNASYVLQGRMCHVQQCNFDYENICNFHHIFSLIYSYGIVSYTKQK